MIDSKFNVTCFKTHTHMNWLCKVWFPKKYNLNVSSNYVLSHKYT